MWFPVRLTFWGRLMIAYLLAFGAPTTLLYVWCRLNPRPYAGALASRIGLLLSGGALDALEGDT